MTPLVLDASAGAEMLLDTTVGRSLEAKLPRNHEWWAPEHYYLEVAGVLRRVELHGLAAPARVATGFEKLRAAKLRRAQLRRAQLRPLLMAAWNRRGHLTVTDALYVVLAEQLGATLVTADGNLARSPGLKVPTITP